MTSDDLLGEDGTVGKFFGGLLIAAGLLIAVSAGLCTGVVIFNGGFLGLLVADPSSVTLPFVFGGLPMLFGLFLFFKGRRLWRDSSLPER